MKGHLNTSLMPLLATLLLSACSGGSEVDSGIGGTGFVAQGEITDVNAPQTSKAAVSTITVNGVSYGVGSATVTLDDVVGDSSGLGVGMVVTVSGDAGGTTASSVVYDDDVEGPIAGLVVTGDSASFTVLGVSITATRAGTTFANEGSAVFGFDNLANDVLVEVSGLRNAAADLEATRIERQEAGSGATEVELKGTVSALDVGASTFTLGSFSVQYDGSTQFEDLPGGSLSDGDFVEAKGILNGAGDTLLASEIEGEDDSVGNDGDQISVEGIVSEFVSLADFKVGTRRVDASNATFQPASLASSLANGLRVEAEGQLSGDVLIADEVEQEGEEVKVTAVLKENPASTSLPTTITLAPRSGSDIVVRIESSTEMEDARDDLEPFTLSDLLGGDFLDIEGRVDSGSGQIVAQSLKRLEQADRVIVEGPVEALSLPESLGTPSVTVLGVTFSISPSATDFEDENDLSLSYSEFRARVQLGMTLKVRDDVDSGTEGDGIADEVAIEH